MDNKAVEKVVTERVEELQSVVRVMRRANNTGDDVRIEIDSGLNLLTAIAGDILDLVDKVVSKAA